MKTFLSILLMSFCSTVTIAQVRADTSAKWSNYKSPQDPRKDAMIKKYGVKNGSIIAKNDVRIGFTMNMVSDALGTPTDIHESANKNKVVVTFEYKISEKYTDYYYFENKRLTGWKK